MKSEREKTPCRRKKAEDLSPCVIESQEKTLCCTEPCPPPCISDQPSRSIVSHSDGTLCVNDSEVKYPMPYNKLLLHLRVFCDIGYGNGLFIRGSGGGLSWDRGFPLHNIAHDQWIWETSSADVLEFKLLINDEKWENGGNHFYQSGSSMSLYPSFGP